MCVGMDMRVCVSVSMSLFISMHAYVCVDLGVQILRVDVLVVHAVLLSPRDAQLCVRVRVPVRVCVYARTV